MAKNATSLRRRALRIDQDPNHPLFLFSLTGSELLQIAETSRISRDDAGKLLGYQRAEVKKHVKNIVDYLDSEQVIFPNAIILALSSGVKFRSSRGPDVNDGCAIAGTLDIPLNAKNKPAWIVDGQQRALALSMCRRQDFAIPVSAFIADEVDLQRDQFLRVNSSKNLPPGLITELLPEVSTPLPAKLAARKPRDTQTRSAEGAFVRVRQPSAPQTEGLGPGDNHLQKTSIQIRTRAGNWGCQVRRSSRGNSRSRWAQ